MDNIMKRLKPSFHKNGLEYTLIKRTEKVALFRLGSKQYPDGYEVCRIYIMRPHKAFGITFEESEIISSNTQFILDGSGYFRGYHNALMRYNKLSEKFVRKDNVDDLNNSDNEGILECQPIEDNSL
jgi:hypothetical protein